MQIRFTWGEYKAIANKAIKAEYPDVVIDDTVQFTVTDHNGERSLIELPDNVTFICD